MMKKLIRLLKQLKGFIPTKVPSGTAEFEAWVTDLEETYTLPTLDKDSVRFVMATAIMNLGQSVAYKPKFYFYLVISAGAAKQIAGSVFYEIKQKQQAAEKAAREAAIAAASANG